MSNVSKKEWEQAEVKRSATEAGQINKQALLSKEKEIVRYISPPSDTCFPLEYAYYLLGDIRGKSLLEYGCGDGLNSVILAKRGANVTALDISIDLINVARQRLEVNKIDSSVNFVVGSAHDLPIADESVDVVFGMAILHHLDLEASSKEVFRVLKRGGRAIFQEPIRNSKLIKVIRNLIPYQDADVSPFERPLTDLELIKYAENFKHCKIRSFSLPFVNLLRVLRFSKPYSSAIKMDRTILDKLPFLEYYATVKVYEMYK